MQEEEKNAVLRRLKKYNCKVCLKDYGDKQFTTNRKVLTISDNVHETETVYIAELDEWWNINQITYIGIEGEEMKKIC